MTQVLTGEVEEEELELSPSVVEGLEMELCFPRDKRKV